MEVRKGFKQTEIGVFPEDWQVTTISNVADTSSGTTPSRSMLERYYNNGTIYWVKTLDLNNSEIFSTEENVTQEAINETSLKIYPAGTVLVAMYGGFNQIGRTGLLRNPATINQALTAIRPNTKVLSSEYLLRVLNYRVNYWKSIASSSRKDPNITGRDVREFPLAFPKVEEQHAIAAALSDVDALLNSLDALIAKKRLIKQGTMQELLTGKKRLPGFSGDWKVIAIGEEIDLLTGYPFPSSQYTNSGVRLLRCSNIKRGVTDWTEEITQYWVDITFDLTRYSLQEGDLVIAMDGSLVGKSYASLSKKDLPALLLQRAARIRSNRINIGYLKQHVGSEYFVKYVDAVKTVTAIPHISSDDIRNFEIALPPTVEEQTAIAEILSDMDAEISALEQKREKTRLLKQGMMQELLTGRIRLV